MSLSLSSGPFKLETTGDGLQYYDQVIAVSQAAINEGFIKLFEEQPLVARSVHWRNEEVFDGQLIATMLPPQIELDVESGGIPQFTLQLRFDKGRIFFGRNTYQTIDGWVIAFTPLSFQSCLNPSTGDLAAATAVEDTEENVSFKMDRPTKIIPGEYSIHRLFAAIADLNWGSIIWERSYMIQPNRQKLYLDKWAQDPANNALYNEVQQCLREWTMENTLASCFTQGMLLKVPKPKMSSGKVTFAPRALKLQNYPYIDEERQMTLTNTKQAMKGTNGSPYNCLCYCEVVGTRVDLPSTKFLPFSGNLAGPSKGTGDEYLGSFVIDRRRFSGMSQLSSQLQELCIAMQTIPLEPEMRIGWPYLPSGRRQRLIGNTTDLTAGKPYRWKELANTTGTAGRNLVSVAERKTKISSMSKITIEAGPQMTAYKVSGEYGYSRRTDFSSIAITDIASWSFTISVNGSQDIAGDLSVYNNPSINFERCRIEQDPYTGLNILIPDDYAATLIGSPTNSTWLLMRTAMKVNIGRALAKMKNDFTPFQGITKLMYPGNGELKFGPTMFNEELNLFATIDYSPKENRVNWPQPEAKELANNIPTGYFSDITVTKDVPHLTWTSVVNTYDRVTQTIKLTLTALNNANEAKAFKSVSAVCLKMKSLDSNTLFQAEPQRWAVKVAYNATSSGTWSIVTSKFNAALELKTESLSNGLGFNISPTGLDTARDGSSLPSKFIVPPAGSFTLELNGAVSTKANAGIYIVQLNEAWVGVRPNKPLQGGASTFLVLELKADGQNPAAYTVTQAAADIIRGVSQT